MCNKSIYALNMQQAYPFILTEAMRVEGIYNTNTYDYILNREPSWKPHVFLVAIGRPANANTHLNINK